MSAKYATQKALLRVLSRLRFVEGECRDLKRNIDALRARETVAEAIMDSFHKD